MMTAMIALMGLSAVSTAFILGALVLGARRDLPAFQAEAGQSSLALRFGKAAGGEASDPAFAQ